MSYARPAMAPEILLEKVTLEALSALALGSPDHIHDIAPLKAALPLIAKERGLPEKIPAGKPKRLARGKKLAAENKGGEPGEPLLDCYDGAMIAGLLWALFRTEVRLEKKEDRVQFPNASPCTSRISSMGIRRSSAKTASRASQVRFCRS